MLFGSPLRDEISRSGSASPEARNAPSTRDEWTTDLTRYGSRGVDWGAIRTSKERRFRLQATQRNDRAKSRGANQDSRRFCELSASACEGYSIHGIEWPVSHRQTDRAALKCFDAAARESYKSPRHAAVCAVSQEVVLMFRRLTSLSVAALLILCAAVQAQESASAGIAGQVLDSTKAAVPGASVTVVNAGTNAQRVATTDAEGRFTVPNLPPASYVIRVELSGFNTIELKDFVLRNGEIAKPQLTLSLANVAGTSPLLQVSNASVGQSIGQKQIEDLPVSGRNPLAFAALAAGVTPQAFNRGTQFGAAGSSRSQYVTVEGGRDSSTNYAIDGVYVRSLRHNSRSLTPQRAAAQEVNPLRNSYPTTYGQCQALVSTVT